MEDPPSNPSETPNQRQARLRRERREAKIKNEGNSRLEKITKVSGRQQLPDAPSLQPTQSPHPTDDDDPPIQSLPAFPNASNQQPSEADLRTLLRAAAPENADPQTQQQQQDDPMMQMLSQLMGGMPGGEGGGDTGGLPPGLAAMMGGMPNAPGGGAQKQQQQGGKVGKQDYVWKIVHAVFSFALAAYVATATTTFREGPLIRVAGKGQVQEGTVNLFWAFATVELVLQSTRYFLEMGKTGSPVAGGMVGALAMVLPQPWRGYLVLAARYSGIWSTVVEDGCVIVFVVGVLCWWNGAAG